MAENMAYKQSMNPRGQARRNGARSAFPRVLRRHGSSTIPSVSKFFIAGRRVNASRPVEIGAGRPARRTSIRVQALNSNRNRSVGLNENEPDGVEPVPIDRFDIACDARLVDGSKVARTVALNSNNERNFRSL